MLSAQINQQGDGWLQVLAPAAADDTAMNSFGLTTLIQFLREDDLGRSGERARPGLPGHGRAER